MLGRLLAATMRMGRDELSVDKAKEEGPLSSAPFGF